VRIGKVTDIYWGDVAYHVDHIQDALLSWNRELAKTIMIAMNLVKFFNSASRLQKEKVS
jgi:hypothetical protein